MSSPTLFRPVTRVTPAVVAGLAGLRPHMAVLGRTANVGKASRGTFTFDYKGSSDVASSKDAVKIRVR